MISFKLYKNMDADQLSLSSSDAASIREMIGAGSIRLGNPKKGRPFIVLNCVTKSGKRFQLRQGDSHSFWLAHQQGLGNEWFKLALMALSIGEGVIVNAEDGFLAKLKTKT